MGKQRGNRQNEEQVMDGERVASTLKRPGAGRSGDVMDFLSFRLCMGEKQISEEKNVRFSLHTVS